MRVGHLYFSESQEVQKCPHTHVRHCRQWAGSGQSTNRQIWKRTAPATRGCHTADVDWKLVRATTRDGVTYGDQKTVYEQSAPWSDHFAVAKNADTGEYLALKLKADNSGFAYTAFFSIDGKQWKEHPGNPLFYDGDSMSLFWSPVLHRFVCINKSLQPYRKRIIDHGGPTPSLGDDSLRDRRVLMMRSSPDGRRWEPSVSMVDVWNRNGRKGAVPTGFMTLPMPKIRRSWSSTVATDSGITIALT